MYQEVTNIASPGKGPCHIWHEWLEACHPIAPYVVVSGESSSKTSALQNRNLLYSLHLQWGRSSCLSGISLGIRQHGSTGHRSHTRCTDVVTAAEFRPMSAR